MADPVGTDGPGEPAVSIVIVNWNARSQLLDCLGSLERHPPARPWEVIVVDNGSADGSAAAVRAQWPWARVIANDDNRGLAAANNQGLMAARADRIVISNPDVLYSTGAIDQLCALLDRRRTACFAVPRLLHPDGTLQTSAGDLPGLRDALLGRQAARRTASSAGEGGFWWDSWSHDRERVIGHGAEACYAVKRAAIAEIGLQDEKFALDWETIDWSARARAAGWEVWFCPGAEVVHLGGVSIRQAPFHWIVASHRGMYRYFRKRSSVFARPFLAAAFGARALAKLAAVLLGVRMYERAHRAPRQQS